MNTRNFTIGILFESDEWSDHKLAHELEYFLKENDGSEPYPPFVVKMIDMENEGCVQEARACDLLVSRVFASALNRGHERSLQNMETLIAQIDAAPDAAPGSTPVLINEPRAHRFEIDKEASTVALREAGILVPDIYQMAHPNVLDPTTLSYPCIVKPNCSGRTTNTAIVRNAEEAARFLETLPDREFLAQEYITPEKGFITRVEIVDGKAALIVKRSIADNGLSAYRFGSTYDFYPDVPETVIKQAERAAKALGFTFGSFDIIETERGAFFIDANSISNVSEDCTETFDMDLMREYARVIARIARQHGHEMRAPAPEQRSVSIAPKD